MDTNQPTDKIVLVAPSSTGVFGTKIPSTVAFIVAVLLFFMPFIDIKCNNMSLQQVSGFQLATGFKMKNNSSDNSILNDMKTDGVDKTITKTTTKSDNKDPNMYALIGLGLGVLGLILSFTNAKAAIGGAMIMAVGGAAALVGLMIDIKNKIKMDMPDTKSKSGEETLDKLGQQMTDNIRLSVDFTPWFFISIVAFLVAAVFCFQRMRLSKTTL
jgi:hypothetical protein